MHLGIQESLSLTDVQFKTTSIGPHRISIFTTGEGEGVKLDMSFPDRRVFHVLQFCDGHVQPKRVSCLVDIRGRHSDHLKGSIDKPKHIKQNV